MCLSGLNRRGLDINANQRGAACVQGCFAVASNDRFRRPKVDRRCVLGFCECQSPSPLTSTRTSPPSPPKSAPPSSRSAPRCAVLSRPPWRLSSTECRRTSSTGRAVASFAGWKNHYALYFVSSTLFDAITKELKGREASKGIIRFNLDEPVPESIVRRLADWNAAVAGGAAVSGPKKPTKPKKKASPGPKRKTSR